MIMEKDAFFKLFIQELADIYSAEVQLVEALPLLVQAVSSSELKNAIQTHLEETRNQVRRLERVFQSLKTSVPQKTCEAMQGLIREAQKVLKENFPPAVKDAAIISAAQRVEHYEIAVYGTLRTFANQLDLDDIADILQESLDEEGSANKKLTSIAEGGFFTTGVNQKAARQS